MSANQTPSQPMLYTQGYNESVLELKFFLESFCPDNPKTAIDLFRQSFFVLYSDLWGEVAHRQHPVTDELKYASDFLYLFLDKTILDHPTDPEALAVTLTDALIALWGSHKHYGCPNLDTDRIFSVVHEVFAQAELHRSDLVTRLTHLNALLDCFDRIRIATTLEQRRQAASQIAQSMPASIPTKQKHDA